MKNKKVTVTIGIPALNEEKNIKSIIIDLLGQKEVGFLIDKIIINSDGSKDDTVKIVKNIVDRRVKLIDNKSRKGVPTRQNQIIRSTNSDILVILNADITIKDQLFISKLIEPIVNHNYDLVSGEILPLKAKTFVEKVLYRSVFLKKELSEKHLNGNNVYLCHGPVRAFSKRFYSKLIFADYPGEDAFSYFSCIKMDYKFLFNPNAVVEYKLPNNIKDHQKQSVRFFQSRANLLKQFDANLVNDNYNLPKLLFLRKLIKYLFLYPIETSAYVGIAIYMNLMAKFSSEVKSKWQIADSSK